MSLAELPVPVLVAFGLAVASLGVAVLIVASWRVRDGGALGERVHAVRPGGPQRGAAVAAVVAAQLFAWRVLSPSVALACALVSLFACAIAFLRPFDEEQACGHDGVRRGWIRRSFGALDEWRLTGRHLRFRVGRFWHAVELPETLHEPVGARLRALAPERESAFK